MEHRISMADDTVRRVKYNLKRDKEEVRVTADKEFEIGDTLVIETQGPAHGTWTVSHVVYFHESERAYCMRYRNRTDSKGWRYLNV